MAGTARFEEKLSEADDLYRRYESTGTDSLARDAIAIYEATASKAPPASDPWFRATLTLMQAYQGAFWKTGDASFLNHALEREQIALQADGLSDIGKAVIIDRGSGTINAGCERMVWDTEVLESRIDKQRHAIGQLRQLSASDIRAQNAHLRLASMLNLLARRTLNLDAINESVSILEQLLTDDAAVQMTLASSLTQRYQNFGENPADINKVVDLYADHLATTEEDTEEWAEALSHVAHSIATRAHHTPGFEADTARSTEALRRILVSSPSKRSIYLTAQTSRSLGWASIAWSAGAPDYETAAWAACIAVERFEQFLVQYGSAAVANWLDLLQGLASEGAYSLAMMNRTDRAVELLERGTGMLRSIWVPDISMSVPLADSRYHDALLAYFKARESANDGARSALMARLGDLKQLGLQDGLIQEVSPADESPLLYLLTTEIGGMAILCLGGLIEPIELPGCGSPSVREWASRIRPLSNVNEAPRPATQLESTSGLVDIERGIRGEGLPPSPFVIREMLAWLREQLSPVVDRLHELSVGAGSNAVHLAASPIRIVPVGPIGWLPISSIFATIETFPLPATMISSARILLSLRGRGASYGQEAVLAITPGSLTVNGREWPKLLGAEEEGRYLFESYQTDWLNGGRATSAAFEEALRSREHWLAIHIAAHGELEHDRPELSRFYLEGEHSAEGTAYSVAELEAETLSARLVFLASCWLGQADAHLPDESMGFPAALLRSGAAAVIAPLWPVDDRATKDLVVTFYDAWLGQGGEPSESFAMALRNSLDRGKLDAAAFVFYGL